MTARQEWAIWRRVLMFRGHRTEKDVRVRVLVRAEGYAMIRAARGAGPIVVAERELRQEDCTGDSKEVI